jgi:hypothetical protein
MAPQIDLATLDPFFRIGSVLGLVAGIGLIIINTLQILGVLLVIVSLVSLLAVVHTALSTEQSAVSE